MTAVWSLEWRLAVSDRRRFVAIALVPLLVVAFVRGVAGPVPAAAVYVVVFLAFPVLGSAVPLRWDGERGMVARVVRGGVPAGLYLLVRAGAGAAIDLVQLIPALVLVGLGAGASPAAFTTALVALAVSVWLGGLVGVLAAALSRSIPETGLVAGMAVLLLAHVSGAFHDPAPGSFRALIEGASPFRALHEAFLDLPTGASAAGLGGALVWTVLLPALVWLLGESLTMSLGRVKRGGLEGV